MDEKELQYFISEKGPYLVASLEGVLTKSTIDKLETCGREILEKKAETVILSLHGVSEIQLVAVPTFVKLEASIRQKPAKLKLCFVRADVLELLHSKGAIRTGELFPTLKEALVGEKKRD